MVRRGSVGSLVLAILLGASPAGAGWPPAAQKEIVADAITVSPKELKALLEKHKAEVQRGAEIPLLTLRDFRDQAFYPSAPAAGAVRKAAEHTAGAAAALRANDDARAARQLGMAATYAAGVVQPRRFAGRETGHWEFHSQVIPSSLKLAAFSRPVKLQELLEPAGKAAAGMGDDHQSDTERYEMALRLVRDVWLVAWLDGGRDIEEDLKVERSYKRVGEARAFTADMVKKQETVASVQTVQRWVIPFDKGEKNAIFVKATLNDKVNAAFIVDTGATLMTISWATVRELGIRITSDTEWAVFQTANGAVRSPIIEIASVAVGQAKVNKVKASVCNQCALGAVIEGLLGLSYLNHFNYRVDPERGHLVLETK